MAHATLRSFNPRNVAVYEAELWRAYYDRKWVRSLALLFRLLRSQFSLRPIAAVRATYWALRAAMTWAPPDHDRAQVGELLRRFYCVLQVATGSEFDPGAAGAAELEYWAVHRDLSGQQGTPELVEALAQVTVQVYGVTREEAEPAAVARARACDLVDEITSGTVPGTQERWSTIATTLHESYSLLSSALQAKHTAAA